MKQQKKSELIGNVIGLFCIHIILGVMLHFGFGYDFVTTIKILAAVTSIMIVGVILVGAILILLSIVARMFER